MGWRACITKLSACHPLLPLGFRPVFGEFAGLVRFPEVGPALGGQPLRLRAPPGPDLVVVAGGQYLRYRFSLEDRRPRVLRVFEQTVREAFFGGGSLLAHDARQKPHAGIQQCQRSNFAAGEDEIPERHFFQSARLDQPFVDALEAGAHNHRTQAMRELHDAALSEARTARAHQQARPGVARDRVERTREHVRLHHHSGAAARRRIIDGAVLVGGMRAYVDSVERPDARRKRLAGEALRQRAGKHFREDGQYARAPHTHSSRVSISTGRKITICFAARSIFGTVISLNGSIRGSPLPSGTISMISPAPKLCTACTVPICAPSGVTASRPTRSA